MSRDPRDPFRDDAPDARYHDARHVRAAVNALGLGPRPRVLDAGCGSGLAALDIAASHPGASVLGIDASADQVRRARENQARAGTRNARFEVASIETRELPGASFDLVLLLEVAQFLHDPAAAVNRAAWALAPGGWLLVKTSIVPDDEPGREFATRVLRRFITTSEFYASEREWRELLGAAGFASASFAFTAWRLEDLGATRRRILETELERDRLDVRAVAPWFRNALIAARKS